MRSHENEGYLVVMLDALLILFKLTPWILIIGCVYMVQCEKEEVKKKEKVCYTKPIVADTVKHDWANDSTMTQGKIETLNEILAR